MIDFKEVSKYYEVGNERICALDNVTMNIAPSECVVLKGPSGSGKSTILSLIAALSRPSRGTIRVNGVSIAKLMDEFSAKFRQETIGFIFQKYHLIHNLSVYDNIVLPLLPLNLEESVLKERADSMMKMFGLSAKAKISTKHLSGGEQQRVAIARALINDPKIVIADEPTANLDAVLSAMFVEHIRNLKNKGVTIVIATHDPLFFSLDCIDRIIEIGAGKVHI